MDYTLMHKNIPVIDIEIDEDTGNISKLGDVHDERRLPVGVFGPRTGINRRGLNDWWTGRSIPASRDGIRDALDAMGISDAKLLLTKCFGLSLSDQYWVRPKDNVLRWDAVNFFQNDFSQDVGEILFGHAPAGAGHVSFMSPDNTSDGWLRKKWVIADGKRCLMKGGSGVFQQEPFNEVVASAVMRRLGVPHVGYTLAIVEGKPYSLCECFVTPDTDLVTAWRVQSALKKDNRDSNLTHLLRCCDSLGISGARAAIDRMLVVDYIIANEDRHYNNFGFIRNADTLDWLGFAPIFDSGTSLWYNTQRVGSAVESKPFRSSHAEQIKLVGDLGWFDAGALKGLDSEIAEIFSTSEEVSQARSAEIAKTVMERIDRVAEL